MAAPLTLVELRGDGPLRMGVPSDVCGAKDHALARVWAEALHDHGQAPDGIIYPSRLNGQTCIALFARAFAKLTAIAAPALLDCGADLDHALSDLDIDLAP